jgi:hypothetical protein
MKARETRRKQNRSRSQSAKGSIRIGGTVDKATATIQLLGKRLDPDHVTRLLRVTPSSSRRRGDLVNPPYPARTRQGIWSLRVKDIKGNRVESTLWRLLEELGPPRKAWSTVLTTWRATATCRLGLFLAAWNRGLELSPDLLRELGRRRIGLLLDIYGDNGRVEWVPESRRRRSRSFQGVR